MKIAGIIAEYNPFHNGHKYHIQAVRDSGFTHIAVAMSGHAVQRGEFSVCDKWQRAKAAVENGADIVFEIPCTVSLRNAEGFAFGAVEIFKRLGCADTLAFGSECDDIEALKAVSTACEKFSGSKELLELLESGFSYPLAMQSLVTRYYGEDLGNILTSPNNTLAIEYIKALNSSDIAPFCVKRHAVSHDSNMTSGNFASASYIRKLIYKSKSYSEFVPYNYDNYSNQTKLEIAVMQKLRTMSALDFSKLPDVNQGLENRIFEAVQTEFCLDDIINKALTKRYTKAKIKRIIMTAFLNITKKDAETPLPYIRILAMNDKGKDILSASKSCSLPIDTSLFNLSSAGENAKQLAKLEIITTDTYFLSTENILPCKTDLTHKPIIL